MTTNTFNTFLGTFLPGSAGLVISASDLRPSRDAPDSVRAALETFAADPAKAVTTYGLATGSCALCGRLLTDPVSVARGVGAAASIAGGCDGPGR